MLIYNTLSGKKEEVKNTDRTLRLFVCGPTVYDYSHIGHARTYLAFDIIVRYLRHRDLEVFYLQNITDVDDKIIRRAHEEKRDPLEVARFFTKKYLADMKALHITGVNAYAPATKFIPAIVLQVQTLIRKGYAYKIEGDGYYFDISKFREYGKLSHRTSTQAEDAVSRIDESVKKRNKGDFCVWKFSKPGEPAWKTPLGTGRPGWHIEDTAISEKYFGPQYDLHGGGLDLKFPHHEAEIAQQEAASGKKPFVKIWMHAGILNTNGKKMAKSLKNFLTIRDFLKKYSPEVLRFMVLSHHYRRPMNYTEKLVEQEKAGLEKITDFTNKLEKMRKLKINGGADKKLDHYLNRAHQKFHEAMDDDFNSPAALREIFSIVTAYQNKVWKLKSAEAKKLKEFIRGPLDTLGIKLEIYKIPANIKKLAAEREKWRRNEQFIQSDALRKKLKGLGYSLEDTPLGPWLKPI